MDSRKFQIRVRAWSSKQGRKLIFSRTSYYSMKRAHFSCLVLVILIAGCAAPGIPGKNETAAPDQFLEQRLGMVQSQIRARGISDESVLAAMEKIQRHRFMDESMWHEAYGDHPVPIGEGQTISQPYMVAFMTQSLELKGGAKILEIGTGSGYQASVLAQMGCDVYSIEIIKNLADGAKKALEENGYSNVKTKNEDGYFGWKEEAPFDAIIITASVNHVPPSLFEQLKEGGKIILPLGSTLTYQSLTLVEKINGSPKSTYLLDVRFVPMTGEAEKG